MAAYQCFRMPCAPHATVRRCAPCATSTASLKASRPSAISRARCATSRATCRCCPASSPTYSAPIVRTAADGVRELAMARWGMPLPTFAIAGKKTDPGVTNIRNVKSPHWRRWLGVESRCIVPFTSFAENEVLPDGSRPPVWFAFDDSRPLAFFAGIWTRWTSVRKVREGETTNDLFGFLTTEPNTIVGRFTRRPCPSS